MLITGTRTTPLLVRNEVPYHWAHGVTYGAEVAGVNVCFHGLHETGSTTCAANHAASVIPNLDDGNQYMNHLLVSDVIFNPELSLVDGRLPVLSGPCFGFEIDSDAVARAAEEHRSSLSTSGVGI